MENEPTGSGYADTFSKWIYAARANTDINHKEIVNRTVEDDWWAGKGIKDESYSAWPWSGYNGQLQNGGCSVYTSYHDLMARLYYMGADNCEQRLREIMDRWSLPDHIVGGSPLYLGEIPQQENSGSVGTDYPFPETGILPAIMVFGMLGATVQWKPANFQTGLPAGHILKIDPTLPSSWNGISIRHMQFAGMWINISVLETKIRVEIPLNQLIDPTLQIEIMGIRSLISSIIDSQGIIEISYNSHQMEIQRQFNNANEEYANRILSGQTRNLKGVESLSPIPLQSAPNFLDEIIAWWNHTIQLMSVEENLRLKNEMELLASSTNVSPPLGGITQEIYTAVIRQRIEANASFNRGDLRWTVANYRQAQIITFRLNKTTVTILPTILLQYVGIPIILSLIVVRSFIQIRKKLQIPKAMPSQKQIDPSKNSSEEEH
jgi:hypothetical protein